MPSSSRRDDSGAGCAIYEIWKWHFELKRGRAEPQLAGPPSAEAAL